MTVLDDVRMDPPAADRPSGKGRRAWRVLGSVAAVLGVASGGLWAASAIAHRTETFHRTFDGAAIRVVDISIDSGDVHLVGRHSNSTVDLTQRVTDGLFSTDHSARVDGDRLVVRAECPAFWSTYCAVDIRAVVPDDVRVVVHTDNGLNEVSGLTGDVRLTSNNGDIRARAISGPVHVETDNGDVTLTRLTSATTSVDTDNGDAEVTFDRPPTSVTTQSDNGNVTVTLPAGSATYALRTSTDNGDVSTPIRTDPSSRRHIRASSNNGDITVRYADG